ncbi:MAG TPA: hypothetical protein P5234_03170 [Thermoanaerobaculaceae bacterium]|nr:hypothetical protein [Thermoanaerobaculaceae bacterium]HRS15231.1 hypothetical protein [Thermoanaerobaculaceae bacterium]
MRGFLAVAQREVVDRRMWLAAALAAGLIPLAAPLLPWVDAGVAAEARNVLATVLVAALVTGGAFALGVTMIGSDLAARRFGFYFARPLSAGAIWWGKLAGSWLVVVLVGVLAALPAALAGGNLVVQEVAGLPSDVAVLTGAAAVFVLLVLALAHCLGVIGRSRSVWIVLDLVAAVAVGATLWAVGRRFMLAGPGMLMPRLLVSSLAAVPVALLVAGWVQVAVGRTDPRRGHGALSATLWGTLGSFTLAAVGYAAWVFAATPSSLARLREVMPARAGSWVTVSGDSAGRGDCWPAFLLDTATGRWVRLERTPHWWWFEPMYSADGRRAVWLQPTGDDPDDPRQVVLAELSEPQPRPAATPLILGRGVRRVQLSPSGQRLAVWEERTLTVHSLPDGALLRASRLDSRSGQISIRFVTDDEMALTVWPQTGPSTVTAVDAELWSLDVRSGRLDRTGTLEGTRYQDAWGVPADPLAELCLVYHPRKNARELVLHDARTGAPRATLLSRPDQTQQRVTFLADGRIVASEHGSAAGEPARLHLFDREGRLVRSVVVEGGRLGRFSGELAPGVLAVTVGDVQAWNGRGGRAVLVDLEAGTVRQLAAGHIPISNAGWWLQDQLPAEPGSAASRLFRTPEGGLALYDPASDRFTKVLDTRWPLA